MKKPAARKHTLLGRNLLNFLAPSIVPFIFFVVAILTLPSYGFNWDSPVHFARGQAYLRYILTGKSDYKDLPPFCRGSDGYNSRVDYVTGEVCDKHRDVKRSEYESFILDFNWAKEYDVGGHPPLSDIGLAITNQIFFKSLGWFEDIEAYHLFSVFTTFLLALAISYWSRQVLGLFASVIATLSLYSFPLLFGEQHFNVKDPSMAAFFTIALYFFWLSITKKSWRYMLASSLAAGASFATKINFVFAPVILFPWLTMFLSMQVLKMLKTRSQKKFLFTSFLSRIVRILPKKITTVMFLYPLIVFAIFFLSWPVLWFDTVEKLSEFVNFYQGIGVSKCPFPRFTPDWLLTCSSMISLQYVLFTVPLVTLILLGIGIMVGALRFKEKNFVYVLWLTFFLVTIGRVTLSIASIYGGLRQIMEIIAPIALLTGLGAVFMRDELVFRLQRISLFKKISKRNLMFVLSTMFILFYVPIFFKLAALHPNENLYFNPLIGGLKGAYEKDFPGYGNTYGNAYYQGVQWLNKNAEKNAKIALQSGLAQNLSRGQLRNDFLFGNYFLSTYNQFGEYLILPVSQGDIFTGTFRYRFVDKYLEKVHEIRVEGVPILIIWKNSPEHLKKDVDIAAEERSGIEVSEDTEGIVLELPEEKKLKRLEVNFSSEVCEKTYIHAPISISSDGKTYHNLYEVMNDFTEYEKMGYPSDRSYFFLQEKAKYIKIEKQEKDTCPLSSFDFALYTFP